jgi:hypothetical protein
MFSTVASPFPMKVELQVILRDQKPLPTATALPRGLIPLDVVLKPFKSTWFVIKLS